MKRKIICANWKMNKTFAEAMDFIDEFNILSSQHIYKEVSVVIAPPFPYLLETKNKLNKNIFTSAQNCSSEEKGAYTGETSASMLKSVGADFVIIGHSERRTYFNEESLLLSKKINLALHHKLIPIFCIGESLEQRQTSMQFEVIKSQLQQALFHLDETTLKNIVIAYEPIWAIGTGQTATSQQAQEMHQFIRSIIEEQFDSSVAADISILYGGSCNEQNAMQLFSCEDIDGGLIGGASLEVNSFLKIINALEKCSLVH